MKKLMLMVAVVMMVAGNLSYAGEILKDGSGYQDIPWGSTIEQVKAKFPDAKENGEPSGGKYLVLKKEGMGVYFGFENNGLKSVQARYDDAKITSQKVLDKLTQTYGVATKQYGLKHGIDEASSTTEVVNLWEFDKGGIIAEYWSTKNVGTSFKVTYLRSKEFTAEVKNKIEDSTIKWHRLDSGGVGL